MKNYIAVDAGGSKTRIVVFNEREILEELFITGIGLPIETAEDLPEYRKALTDLQIRHKTAAVAVNLGGRNAMQVQTVTESVFKGIPCRVVRESEGNASLAFGALVGANAVLLAGTGTILIASDSENTCIFGGWGMNIGDGGSGYDIGLCAIKKTLLALDGANDLTPLEKDISGLQAPISPAEDAREICGIRDEVRARLRHTDRRAVAALVKIVADHAAQGEADALEIFAEAGRKMGELIVNGARKLQLESTLSVAVTGGLLNTLPYWQTAFENKINEEMGALRFVYEKDGLMRGVMALARGLDGEK